MKAVLSALLLALPPAARGTSYTPCTLDALSLNREAVPLSEQDKDKFPLSEFGFTWNDEDAATLKWRPQGLAGLRSSGGRDFMAVSWYGRDEEGYADRGARVSFVDVSDPATAPYRHVLLVDENYATFEGLHAGGLAVSPQDGHLHVPDSRSGSKRVYTFDVNDILYVPSEDREQFYNYVYILVRKGSYDVPITPSFMSYDWDNAQILLGTFYQCSSYHTDSGECLSASNNRLAWYSVGEANATTPSCSPFFSEMQGAASGNDPASSNGQRLLWTTSSYGSGHESHLHITRLDPEACTAADDAVDTTDSRTVVYPPGLEDMHIWGDEGNYYGYLWMQTEFGANDGSNNVRTVFATSVTSLTLQM